MDTGSPIHMAAPLDRPRKATVDSRTRQGGFFIGRRQRSPSPLWVARRASSLIQRSTVAPADATRDSSRSRHHAPGAGHTLCRSRKAGRIQANGIALDRHIGIEPGCLQADGAAGLVLLDIGLSAAHVAGGLGLDGIGTHLVAGQDQQGPDAGACCDGVLLMARSPQRPWLYRAARGNPYRF